MIAFVVDAYTALKIKILSKCNKQTGKRFLDNFKYYNENIL